MVPTPLSVRVGEENGNWVVNDFIGLINDHYLSLFGLGEQRKLGLNENGPLHFQDQEPNGQNGRPFQVPNCSNFFENIEMFMFLNTFCIEKCT